MRPMPPPREVPQHGRGTTLVGVALLVLPTMACVAILALGFGAGTTCTDAVSGRTLSTYPCVRVTYAVEVCIATEIALAAVGLLLRPWRRSSPATVIVLAALEVVVLVAAAITALAAG
ncbi:MAG: hypothetical protein JWL72_1310 [Ilumatobacteraceae bacterium]|nr:hypothetical protein [Ilumatobacteraceae bacterium]